jgi:hypothetical protein
MQSFSALKQLVHTVTTGLQRVNYILFDAKPGDKNGHFRYLQYIPRKGNIRGNILRQYHQLQTE